MNMSHLNPSPRSMELLEVGHDGRFHSPDDYDQDTNLLNTLFHSLYPHGHVARLSLRSLGASVAPPILEEVLSGIRWRGTTYVPVGSRRSIEKQQIYLVDENTHEVITDRFQRCSESLIAQFDLLMLSCDVITEENLRVMTVPDAIPGLNDWRGWIRQSVFAKLGLQGGNSNHPFVMGFGEMQAKGEIKCMDDVIADRHQADIILSKRCLKPTPSRSQIPNKFIGRVVLGLMQSPCEQKLNEGISNLLDEHVCSSACKSSASLGIRHVLMRAFRVREQYDRASAHQNLTTERSLT